MAEVFDSFADGQILERGVIGKREVTVIQLGPADQPSTERFSYLSEGHMTRIDRDLAQDRIIGKYTRQLPAEALFLKPILLLNLLITSQDQKLYMSECRRLHLLH